MNHLYEYRKHHKNHKKYFIDCENVNDPRETIYFWEFVEDYGKTRGRLELTRVKKLYSFADGDINNWNVNLEGFQFYNLSSSAFNIIFESNNKDEVYEYFMMLVDAKKYNL